MRDYSGGDPEKFTVSELLIVAGKLVALLAIGYALLAIGGHYLSLRLLFPRPPTLYAPGPDYVWLQAPDGVKLAARHWPNPAAKYTVLYLHGNYEELGSVGEYIPTFVQAGYAVFAYDYRGYGLSEGTPTEANLCADTRLAYDYVRRKLGVPADRIIIFGYSLGGGPAVDLALHEPAAGLVLQGAFVSAYRVRTYYPVFPGDKFVNLAKVPQLKLPVLYLHGMEDRTVPLWHGEALYAATTARKSKLFVEGGHHSRLAEFTGERYWTTLRAFADSL